LIYDAVKTTCEWIRAVEDLPLDQENVALYNESVDHENANIVKSAILAIGMILREVMLTENLTAKFKAYLLEIVIRTHDRLAAVDSLQPYGRVLRDSIHRGAFRYGRNVEYITTLQSTYNQIRARHGDVGDFESKMVEEAQRQLEDN